MLNISSIHPQDVAQSMFSNGGFSWWYVDLVVEPRNGLVLIWFFGLPFLPGSKDYKKPIDRPGVSVAVYRQGRQEFYAFQELSPSQVSFDGESEWCFGATQIRLIRSGEHGSLHADLVLPVPGSSELCIGSVHVEGTLCKTSRKTSCKTSDGAAQHGPHLWSPRMVATEGKACMHYAGEVLNLHGRAYFDGNTSTVPLDQLGIARWRWGRLALSDREVIYYLVDPHEPASSSSHASVPQHWAVVVDGEGNVSRHRIAAIEEEGARRSLYGPRYHRRLRLCSDDGEVDVSVRYRTPSENGPFYLRFLTVGHCHRSGEQAAGTAELLLPEKVDLAWQRPFVRMRHHAVGGSNSIWLPLFNGPRRTRIRRLMRGMTARLLPGRALPPAASVSSHMGAAS